MKRENYKTSPNKQVIWGKGLKCQNCGRSDFGLIKSYDKYAIFFCTHCCCFFSKIFDFPLKNFKEIIKSQIKLKEVKK